MSQFPRNFFARGFASRVEAERQAAKWDSLAALQTTNDCEEISTIYTWAEWCAVAEQNEADPVVALNDLA